MPSCCHRILGGWNSGFGTRPPEKARLLRRGAQVAPGCSHAVCVQRGHTSADGGLWSNLRAAGAGSIAGATSLARESYWRSCGAGGGSVHGHATVGAGGERGGPRRWDEPQLLVPCTVGVV